MQTNNTNSPNSPNHKMTVTNSASKSEINYPSSPKESRKHKNPSIIHNSTIDRRTREMSVKISPNNETRKDHPSNIKNSPKIEELKGKSNSTEIESKTNRENSPKSSIYQTDSSVKTSIGLDSLPKSSANEPILVRENSSKTSIGTTNSSPKHSVKEAILTRENSKTSVGLSETIDIRENPSKTTLGITDSKISTEVIESKNSEDSLKLNSKITAKYNTIGSTMKWQNKKLVSERNSKSLTEISFEEKNQIDQKMQTKVIDLKIRFPTSYPLKWKVFRFKIQNTFQEVVEKIKTSINHGDPNHSLLTMKVGREYRELAVELPHLHCKIFFKFIFLTCLIFKK